MSFSKDKNGFAVLGLFWPNPSVTDLNSSRLPSTMSAKVSMEMSKECLWAVGNQPGNWMALRQCCRNGAAKLQVLSFFLSFSGAGLGLDDTDFKAVSGKDNPKITLVTWMCVLLTEKKERLGCHQFVVI